MKQHRCGESSAGGDLGARLKNNERGEQVGTMRGVIWEGVLLVLCCAEHVVEVTNWMVVPKAWQVESKTSVEAHYFVVCTQVVL